MSNHLHLILEGQTVDADTWLALCKFKQQTGFWFGQQGTGYEWQKDFYDHVIPNDDKGLDLQIEYIIHNPVRAGLVKDWREYFGTYVYWDRNPY